MLRLKLFLEDPMEYRYIRVSYTFTEERDCRQGPVFNRHFIERSPVMNWQNRLPAILFG